MGLDQSATEPGEQEQEKTDGKTDAPGQCARCFSRSLAILDQMKEGRAKARDDDQKNQDDDDFQ